MGDRLEDMIHDLGQESIQQAHAPIYDTLENDSKKERALDLPYPISIHMLLWCMSVSRVMIE